MSLVENMTADWNPQDPRFSDDYRTAVKELIDAKVEGREVVVPERPEAPGITSPADLMEVLKASVASARQAHQHHADGEPAAAGPKRALKAVPKAKESASTAKTTSTKAGTKTPAKKARSRKTA
ncbi:hypothetical protein Lfu02_75490 [Longispora fulva]|uniref:Non-homologous end joining protein Ku n=1 Tax=Longispora fulva TaxID=619741 RepID=A0A8J7GCX0_9ACTN|nr:hypothetical protein [Longispora fulva]MBG6136314.1 non-homologous end joining protein Ku [Longispora fulva]GIG63177.1 hypothetical protein Lfu02_75490 [Longispora fulva]